MNKVAAYHQVRFVEDGTGNLIRNALMSALPSEGQVVFDGDMRYYVKYLEFHMRKQDGDSLVQIVIRLQYSPL